MMLWVQPILEILGSLPLAAVDTAGGASTVGDATNAVGHVGPTTTAGLPGVGSADVGPVGVCDVAAATMGSPVVSTNTYIDVSSGEEVVSDDDARFHRAVRNPVHTWARLDQVCSTRQLTNLDQAQSVQPLSALVAVAGAGS
jgi:hypothetical protein